LPLLGILVGLCLARARMRDAGAVVLAWRGDARALLLGCVVRGCSDAAQCEQAADGRGNGDGLQVHETPPGLLSGWKLCRVPRPAWGRNYCDRLLHSGLNAAP